MKRKRNPGLLVLGNPPAGAQLMSEHVEKLWYHHATEGPRVHEFGTGVRMYALEDGSVLLKHPSKPVWGDL